MMVEGNRVYHLSIVPYFGKIVVVDWLGDEIEMKQFLGVFELRFINFSVFFRYFGVI